MQNIKDSIYIDHPIYCNSAHSMFYTHISCHNCLRIIPNEYIDLRLFLATHYKYQLDQASHYHQLSHQQYTLLISIHSLIKKMLNNLFHWSSCYKVFHFQHVQTSTNISKLPSTSISIATLSTHTYSFSNKFWPNFLIQSLCEYRLHNFR